MMSGLVAEGGGEGEQESHSKVGTLWVRQLVLVSMSYIISLK